MRTNLWKLGAVALLAAVALPGMAKDSKSDGAAACFNKLKGLAGDWMVQDPQGSKEVVGLRYRVTSGGSAIEEIEFPGTDHEMVTFYHLDGDSLVMTHYCHLGNQPRMKATSSSTPGKIVFECAGVGNSKSHNDTHMHGLTIVQKDENHLENTWQLSQDGKPGMTAKFIGRRKAAK
jgi:hypothetical protein